MNLLKMMKQEVATLQLTDKKSIQDFLYRRMGEIFSYDPLIMFCATEERKILCKERINIKNVEKFTINCFSWAFLFVDLLKEFDISAEVKTIRKGTSKEHAYVESTINDEIYLLDLMAKFEDITRIKYGFPTIFNLKISNNSNISTQNQMEKGHSNKELISLEVFVEALKKKIATFNITDPEKSVYIIFKYIEKIMNSPVWENRNIDYFSGIQFLSKMIFALLGSENRPYNSHYINKEEEIYVEVYTLIIGGKNYYFAYQKENNSYKLSEVDESFVAQLEEKCDHIQGYNLSRKR